MQEIRVLVDGDINRVENNLSDIVRSDNPVFNDIKNFILGESKRVRSLLSILYLKANSCSITDDVIKMLTGVELIHNASLLHDDVIDEGLIRRGSQTLYDKYGAKLSVISGDYILSAGVEQLLKIRNKNISDIFLDTTTQMSNAEIIQFINRNKNISIEDYINIISGKTASLFSAALKGSALLLCLDDIYAEKLGKFFGIIFQINNDQNPKSSNNDKKNGVKTAVDILGIEKTVALKDNYKEEIKKLIIELPENKYRKGIEELVNLL